MCSNPQKLRTNTGREITVPCTHCLECLKAYQQNWLVRLTEEAECWPAVNGQVPIIFFTLTYDDKNIPFNYLCNTDLGPALFDSLPSIANPEDVERVFIPITTLQSLGEGYARSRFQRLSDNFLHGADMPPFPAPFASDSLDPGMDLPEEYFPIDYTQIKQIYGKILAFNTVRKSHVQCWLKYCRKVRHRRGRPSYFRPGGNVHRLPDRLECKSFRYFITSEYGPRTFRPHYHGILFGVTDVEFREDFLPYWSYGNVEYSVFDSTKGGILYLSKYCSKGSFDNFFSTTHYIYPNGNEFHSRHYEYSLYYFGVDVALCAPTFHLISKGIGSAYPFRSGVASYWGVNFTGIQTPRGIDYEISDSFPLPSPIEATVHPTKEIVISYKDVLSDKNLDVLTTYESAETRIECCESFNKQTGERYAWSEFVLPPDNFTEQRLAVRRYARKYFRRRKFRDQDGKEKEVLSLVVSEHPLCKYYYRYLRTPGQAFLHASASRSLANSVCEQQARLFYGLEGQVRDDVFVSYRFGEDMVKENRQEILRRMYSRDYSQLDMQDKIDLCSMLHPKL